MPAASPARSRSAFQPQEDPAQAPAVQPARDRCRHAADRHRGGAAGSGPREAPQRQHRQRVERALDENRTARSGGAPSNAIQNPPDAVLEPGAMETVGMMRRAWYVHGMPVRSTAKPTGASCNALRAGCSRRFSGVGARNRRRESPLPAPVAWNDCDARQPQPVPHGFDRSVIANRGLRDRRPQ